MKKKDIIAVILLVFIIIAAIAIQVLSYEIKMNDLRKIATEAVQITNDFNTSALYNWCGQPTGTIRMVGARACDKNTLEDETGALWSYDEVEEDTFYLLWIDDMRTSAVEDDKIVKIWMEKG